MFCGNSVTAFSGQRMTMNRQMYGTYRSLQRSWTDIALIAVAAWCAQCIDNSAIAESAAGPAAATAVETIRERFPDGRLKVEREVSTDSAGNYVNHGAWREWDADGELVADGRYHMGDRAGLWMRRYGRDAAAVLSTTPFDQFDAPFVAKANFKTGQLDGAWIIVDAQDRKCSRVTLKHGKRNGPATLWLPNGDVFRDATFRNGSPAGELRERGASGELTTTAMYVGGRQLVNKVSHFPDSEIKQMEAECLVATITEVATDDFWELRFAEYEARGEQLRHGSWKCWYSNGQLQAAGHFQYDREAGPFTWWHANGQEAVRGGYVDGQPDGTWTWWHANGQKAIAGEYAHGQQVGLWRKWAENGQLLQPIRADAATVPEAHSGVPAKLSVQPSRSNNTQ
jgi:antitoxin component YwqK of YwqJK toxin-antitoxin module